MMKTTLPKKIDLHMHTVISDGTDQLSEILHAVKETGIDLFSVTDHDAIKGGAEMPALLSPGDPAFITGVEFSCRDDEGKYHILGYGYDPDGSSINAVVEKGHSLRMEKTQARLDFIRDRYGFEFSEEDVSQLMSLDNPGKPHIGNLMAKYGYAESKDVAIHDYLNKMNFRDAYVRPEEAIEGILGSGGIPVLAHPIYGDGEELILADELETRILRLMNFGLKGVEGFYSGFSDKNVTELIGLAEIFDLYVTAGSDYHGANKLILLGDTSLYDMSAAPRGLWRFLRDVRVIQSPDR